MTVAKTGLLTICNNILQKLGEAKITDVANATQGVEFNVLNYIDDIVYDIYNRGAWPFLMTMFTNDDTYNLHFSSVALSRSLTIPEEINENFLSEEGAILLATGALEAESDTTVATPIQYTQPRQFIKDHPYQNDLVTGAPTEVTVIGRTLYVNPTPTLDTYSMKLFSTLNYDKLSRESPGSATYTMIPVQWEYVLEAGVLWCMYSESDTNKAALWKTKYDEGIQIMAQQYGLKMTYDERLK